MVSNKKVVKGNLKEDHSKAFKERTMACSEDA
jgi:hypothetical protein